MKNTKNHTLKRGLTIFALLASAVSSQAASQNFTFDGGNTAGFDKLQFNTTQGINKVVNLSVVARNVKGTAFGFFPESARAATNSFFGADVRGQKKMNGGFISARVRLASPDKFTWASWWGWNDLRGNSLLEIDITEHVGEKGGIIIQNYYWFTNANGGAAGKKGGTKPQSWYNSWATYSATWANNGTSVTFRRENAVTTTHTGGTARPNAGLRARMSNSPWPFDNNNVGGFKIFPSFFIDSHFWRD